MEFGQSRSRRSRPDLGVMVWVVVMVIGVVLSGEKVECGSNCIAKCMITCAGDISFILCDAKCVKACLRSISEPLYFCNLGCAASDCFNINVTSFPDKVEECGNSCTSKCNKSYALH